MRKILTSLGLVVFAGAVVVSATGAFFSDTETSTGNTFSAGAIDLQIDNESYVTDVNGNLVFSTSTSWALSDLTNQLFFNFSDLKPGDIGEDTISIHVNNNDAWACMAVDITSTPDNGITEPEGGAGDVTDGDGGELQNFLNFTFWNDDGDNVFESDEVVIETLSGLAGEIFDGNWLAIADSASTSTPLVGDSVTYVGKAWCFGNLEQTPVAQDGIGAEGENGPLVRGTGFTCDGSGDNNIAQTDGITADVAFYAEQSRNNGQFLCRDLEPINGEPPVDEIFVGAAFDEYVDPVTDSEDSCDATVTDGASIQAAIDDASAGQTICVEAGTHDTDTYPLRVNEDNLKLASLSGPTTTILAGGVILDNDGTTITGFTINDSSLLGEIFGVYINTGVSGAVVSYNEIVGDDTVTSRGVVNALGTTDGALIAHNDIHDWHTGVFMNDSSGMIIEFNTLTSNQVGSGNDHPTGNIVRNNHITDNTAEGIGVLSAGAESIMVNFNNIFGNGGAANELNSYAVDAVDAENNWWGDLTPGDEIGGAGAASVDFDPFANSAYPEN